MVTEYGILEKKCTESPIFFEKKSTECPRVIKYGLLEKKKCTESPIFFLQSVESSRGRRDARVWVT